MTLKLHASGSHVTSDLSEVEHAIRLFMDPAAGMEIRVLPGGRSMIRPWGDIAALAAFVEKQSDYKGVYYTINPVLKGTGSSGAASNSDILNRRWLMIDVDPVKAEGAIDLSATDGEHDLARMLANRIVSDMIGRGWPLPVVIDSGNGWHLMYRIDLPNDELSRTLCREALRHMATMFECPTARVDRSVHNASRIAKLPGTWARKGPDTPDRPHRLCRIVSYVDDPRIVTIDQLKALTPIKKPEPTAPANGSSFRLKAPSESGSAYAKAALKYELRTLAFAPEGGRNEALNKAAFALGQFVPGGHLDRATVEAELARVADLIGLDEAEIKGTIRSGIEAGIKNPRTMPEPKRQAKTQASPPGPKFSQDERIIYRASTVVPKRVEWLWPGRIPLGKLTTFAGIGGLGKTFVLCDITARVTKGLGWPDGESMTENDVGQVLFVSGEDDPDDTLVPRMIQLNADLERVLFLKTEIQDCFTLADLDTLDEAMKQADDGVKLVVIDPPTAYLGGVDDHNNAELRSLLSPLKSWAARHRVAVIFNTHVNKGGAGKAEAMMRVMGSVAWVNAVRAAFMFARDPDDIDRVLFVPMKMNIAKRRKGLAYRIASLTDELDGPAKVEWLGEVDITADEAVGTGGGKPRRVVASEWLVDRFREKLEWKSEDLFTAGKHENISRDAIYEAKRILDLPRAKRVTYANGDIMYVWWVPPDWSPLATVATPPSGNRDSCDSRPEIQW